MINLLLGLILLILPFSELLRFQIHPGIYIRVLDVLALALLIILLIKYFHQLIHCRPCLVLAGVLIISNLVNPFSPAATAYLGRTLIYLLLLPFFLSKKLALNKIRKQFFDLGLLIFVLAGLLQYFWYPQLRNLYYLGYDPHAYRLFGLFMDPNISGLVLVWAFWYFWSNPSKYQKPALALILLALLSTYSRISWLCFLIGIGYKFLNRQIQQAKFLGLAALLLISIFFLPKYFGEGTNIWRTNSFIGKTNSFNLVVKRIRLKPLLGIGFNNIYLLKNKQDKPVANNSLYGIDNSLLTVLITSGFLGVLAYLWLFKKLWQQNRETRIFTLIYFVHALSVNSFFIPSAFVYYLLFRISQHK